MTTIRDRIKKNLQQMHWALSVAREDGTPAYKLWWRLAWLYGPCQFSLREITGFDLLRPQPAVSVLMSKQKSLAVLKKVNPWHCISLTENKIIFDAVCTARGLPVPKCCGAFVHGRAYDLHSGDRAVDTGNELHLPESFIVKPAGGAYGRSVTAWTRCSSGWTSDDGENLAESALMERLMSISRSSSLILQDRVYAHPDITALTGYTSVQAVRLVTLRESQDKGEVSVLFGFFKVLGGSSVVDNFAFGYGGNLLCAINVDEGRITQAWGRESEGGRLKSVIYHPNTEKELPGFQIPYWEQVNKLVKRAADVFYTLPTIGWDVAITPSGPMLIEGNAYWDPLLLHDDDWQRVRALMH